MDIDKQLTSSAWTRWTFIQEDDLTLADRFPAWCATKKLAPQIDALLGALRANAAVWPSRAPDALTRALARAVATTPPDAP